jgi:hypothetical protein
MSARRIAGLVATAALALGPLTPAAATALGPGIPGAAAAPLFGITIDRVSRPERLASTLGALPQRPTSRVYFDTHERAAYYEPALRQIHAVSGVMGELLDSSQEKSISTEALTERVGEYVATLAGLVDIWEIGNEVNGNWTGPYETVAAKLSESYEIVHAAGGRTALTLYANAFGPEHCGDGEEELTPVQFSERWVPRSIAEGLDYVLLSYYPSQCGGRLPSSAEVAAQLEGLHALYPNATLGFGEIGLPHPASRNRQAEAEAIMRWAYSLSPGLPYYAGGYFWWYGYEDILKPKARLAMTFDESLADEAAALGG